MPLFNAGNSVKIISIIFLVSLSFFATAEEKQRPMFGNNDRTKHPESIENDNLFIAKATHTFGTREHASEGYVERGFDLYSNNKLNESMKCFNQAWLLDNENPYVYLGFGLLLNKDELPCEATAMFKLAHKKGLKESGFLADYATTSTQCALINEKNERIELFNVSNELHNQASQTPHKLLRAYVYNSWAKSYFSQENFLKSQEMIELSKNLGGTIDTALLESIKEKLKGSN